MPYSNPLKQREYLTQYARGWYQRFAVDHDHVTGRVRGLLCMNCNSRLGTVEAWFYPGRSAIESYIGNAPALRPEDFTQ